MILPTGWQQQNINQTSNSQQTPHTSPSRVSYGVFVMGSLKKIDRVVMASHCIFIVAPFFSKNWIMPYIPQDMHIVLFVPSLCYRSPFHYWLYVYNYNMTVWILVGNDINFSITVGLIKLLMLSFDVFFFLTWTICWANRGVGLFWDAMVWVR